MKYLQLRDLMNLVFYIWSDHEKLMILLAQIKINSFVIIIVIKNIFNSKSNQSFFRVITS